MNFNKALARAKQLGHDLENDPPANELSRVRRKTCRKCGAAVLGADANAWGTAIVAKCSPAPTVTTGLTSGPSAPAPTLDIFEPTPNAGARDMRDEEDR